MILPITPAVCPMVERVVRKSTKCEQQAPTLRELSCHCDGIYQNLKNSLFGVKADMSECITDPREFKTKNLFDIILLQSLDGGALKIKVINVCENNLIFFVECGQQWF